LEIQFLLKIAQTALLRHLQEDRLYRRFARYTATGDAAYQHLKRNLENILKVDMSGTHMVQWYSYYLTRLDSCIDTMDCCISELRAPSSEPPSLRSDLV